MIELDPDDELLDELLSLGDGDEEAASEQENGAAARRRDERAIDKDASASLVAMLTHTSAEEVVFWWPILMRIIQRKIIEADRAGKDRLVAIARASIEQSVEEISRQRRSFNDFAMREIVRTALEAVERAKRERNAAGDRARI